MSDVDTLNDEERADVEHLYCFINAERVCGADCMAFLTFPLKTKTSELSELQSHCGLLKNADRVGRNITILAKTLVDTSNERRKRQQDEQRTANATPASPVGVFATPVQPFPGGVK